MGGSLAQLLEAQGIFTYDPTDTEVVNLLLQILRDASGELIFDSLSLQSNALEVLLDLQVDGMRYMLTRSSPQPGELQISLSPREQEIARLIIKGLPNKTIAAVLDISPWTVSTHLRRIFAKLGVSSRAEMVARVLEEGLLKSGG